MNDSVILSFLARNLPDFADRFLFSMIDSDEDQFSIQCQDGKILISANGYVSAFHGFYCYLKKYCGVQLSWCGNREIKLRELTLFDGVYKKTIPQKYRVYMNYCTLDYSMAWWDFDRWEKEIDFMVGSPIASRPQMIPVFAGPCCQAKPFYDTALFEQAVKLFLSAADDFYHSDGYQFDLCDMVRQVLSNRFYQNQVDFAAAYQKKDLSRAEIIAKQQEKLLRDMDALTSCRSELTLAMRIRDAHRLAADEREKRYFDLNARALVTLWGDIDGSTNTNCDYSWREWSGLIKEYYLPRWQMFFDDTLHSLRTNTPLDAVSIEHYWERDIYLEAPFGKRLAAFEQSWVRTCKDYPAPTDCDCIPLATQLLSEMDNLY